MKALSFKIHQHKHTRRIDGCVASLRRELARDFDLICKFIYYMYTYMHIHTAIYIYIQAFEHEWQ